MKFEIYLIEAITNMHVGGGDINYDVVDNQVQKDPISNIPIIHSSSLKGAYREASGKESKYTKYIFGSNPDESDAHQSGAFVFFEAKMLSRPVRSNKRAYYMATSPFILKEFTKQIKDLGIDISSNILDDIKTILNTPIQDGKATVINGDDGDIYIETLENPANIQQITLHQDTINLLGDNIVLLSESDFKKLPLPIIARNRLENGESKNLWYEEIVPKMSRFYFAIGKPNTENIDNEDREKIENFEKRFGQNHLMQFGANKSIGYGYSKVKRISK